MSQVAPRILNWRFSKRAMPLLIVLGVLLITGFYTVTDSSRLAHSAGLDGADYTGYAVCHRITDRSFSIAGRQLPLCSRCTGMYLGIVLAFVVLAVAGRRRWSALPPLKVMLALVGFLLLMGIDGMNSYSHFFPNLPHLYEPRNWLRLVTGMGTGLAIGIIVFPSLAQTLWRDQQYRPSIESLAELGAMLLLATVLVFLVLSNQPTVLYVLGLASAGGIILAFMALNTMILLIVTKQDARADNLRQAVFPLTIGLLLALIELGAISFTRYTLTGTLTGFPGL